jgi:hypothetical protein
VGNLFGAVVWSHWVAVFVALFASQLLMRETERKRRTLSALLFFLASAVFARLCELVGLNMAEFSSNPLVFILGFGTGSLVLLVGIHPLVVSASTGARTRTLVRLAVLNAGWFAVLELPALVSAYRGSGAR